MKRRRQKTTGGRSGAGAATAAGAVAVLVALAVSACGGRDVPGEAADAVPPAPAVLAEAPADVPHLSVQLLEVTRVSDGAIDVRFSISCAADAPAPVPIADLLASAPADAGTVADVFAVDEAAGKTYFVVRDAERRPVGSRDLDPIPPGGSRVLWTRLGAPPPGVAAVTIQVPQTPPFAAVSIAEPQAAAGRPPGEPLPGAGRM